MKCNSPVIEALLFSFVIYVCYVWINYGRLPFHVAIDAQTKTETVLWEPVRVAQLAGIAFAVAIMFVFYLRFDGNRLFRLFDTESRFFRRWFWWADLTARTTRNSIWNDILESEAANEQVVQVELADGRSVLGILFYYSDLAEDCALYLIDAEWVNADGERIPILGAGILLTKNSGIKSISLLDSADTGKENAPDYVEP